MEILIVRDLIRAVELEELAQAHYIDLIKGVADIERGVIALGGEWHMDGNTVLIADGSDQQNVWGFNIYPAKRGDEAIEYTSLINIRPRQGNTSIELADESLRAEIRALVKTCIPHLEL